MLGRLGGWCARHGKLVVALWMAAAIGLTVLSFGVGRPVSNDVRLPGTESQRAIDLAQEKFGPGYGPGGLVHLVLYTGRGKLTGTPERKAVDRALEEIRKLPNVVSAESPYRFGGISANQQIGQVLVRLTGVDSSRLGEVGKRISAAAEPARAAGVEVVPVDNGTPADKEIKTGTSEIIGLLFAAVILVAAFGSVVAAGIPIFAAILSLGAVLAVIGMLGHVVDVPQTAPVMASMIGLGVGIDYALFLLSRHRRLLQDGIDVPEAVARTVSSSGGAVVFAGGTVIVALSGLMLAGFPMLITLAWTTGVAVLGAVLAAITFVPALLGLLGHRVNALRIGGTRRGRRGAGSGGGWGAIAGWVSARPWRVLIGTVVVLGLLSAPALGLGIGQLDDGYADQGTSTRRAYELISAGFGKGAPAPMFVVAELGTPAASAETDPRLEALEERLKRQDGVAHVTSYTIADDRTAALLTVIAETAPSDRETVELVDALRDLDRRPDPAMPDVKLLVGGEVAGLADAGDLILGNTWPVLCLVVGLSALLLLFAFRAPLVALKAALMNLISLGTAFGVITVVFTWGWGTYLIGLDPPPSAYAGYVEPLVFSMPIDAYVPLLLFAVLFGLSMDYEVFLLTAVRQAFLRTGDNRGAVAEGLAATGRVITSAALIMVVVFAAFVAYPDPVVKVFGIGLMVAILVDATVIRGLLVPATMILLGRWNWWCPRWLDRLLPDLSIADHGDTPEAPPTLRKPDNVLV
ncbi:MMPL family transporter [Rhizohabitans arisaemae]|uniref:MMPL family transporter n=1 Tax=Rhizohabitans arisaemae TaxID=2720610 RepID=UPI0024B17B0D|nr:MMPL family transporter [Rhizohabitans arisaemae]